MVQAPGQQHLTLSVRTSVIVALASGLVSIGLAVGAWPRAASVLVVGIVCGAIVGLLQARAIKQAPDTFASAATALAVRAALMATPAGKLAIWLQWLTILPLFAAWFSAGAKPAFAPIAGYAAFMCLREIASLPGLLALRHVRESHHAK